MSCYVHKTLSPWQSRVPAKQFNFCLIRPQNLYSLALRIIKISWQTVNCHQTAICLLLRMAYDLSTQPYRPDWRSVTEMVVFLAGSPISAENTWSSVRVTVGFLVTSPIKTFLLRLITQKNILVVLNAFLFTISETTVNLGTLTALKMKNGSVLVLCFMLYHNVNIDIYKVFFWL